MEDPLPSKKTLFQPSKGKSSLRRCYSENKNVASDSNRETVKLKKYSTFSDLQNEGILKLNKDAASFGSESSRREKSLGLLCER